MGSGDLNLKKSWHPKKLKNRAAVWESQQAVLAERKKIESLKREIEDERAQQELRELNARSGHGPRQKERVEWLYSGPGAQNAEEVEREAYLLGKKRIDEHLDKASAGKGEQGRVDAVAEQQTSAPAFSKQELAQKMFLDPLLAIKKQEQANALQAAAKAKAAHELELRKEARRRARDDERRPRRRYSDEDEDDRHRSSRRSDREDDRRHRSSRYDEDDRRGAGRSSRRSRSTSSYSSDDSRRRSRRRSPSPRRYDDRDRDRHEKRRHHHDDYRTSRGDDRYRRDDTYERSTRHDRRYDRADETTYERHERRTTTAEEADDGDRAARLAAMTDAASELDAARERRMTDSRRRDEDDRRREAEQRDRERELGRGRSSAYLRSVQLSAGTVR